MVPVADQTRNTLQPLIDTNIQPGTRVISDGWAAYAELHTFSGGGIYQHNVVAHQHNFVNPMDGISHTQNVESLWKRAKKIKMEQVNNLSRHIQRNLYMMGSHNFSEKIM